MSLVSYGGARGGRTYGSHRIAYELTKGTIPEGLFVMHSCDNPACLNPDHLSVGTAQDNAIDRERKNRGRDSSGENNPKAKLTEGDVASIRYCCIVHQVGPGDCARVIGLKDPHSVTKILRYSRWPKVKPYPVAESVAYKKLMEYINSSGFKKGRKRPAERDSRS